MSTEPIDDTTEAGETHSPSGSDHPGRIGPYKILEPLGEGGMGEVYLAEQTEPVRRQVAVKVIKLGMDTKMVLARFEAERQALALMDHPSIAKVLDAGTTGGGRPYFVMEYIRGLPLTEYCDLHKLSTDERLELFILLCQAIQHAHQKAVIHRDLKPSNVLVTVPNGHPVPKVIDFGIAKAMGHRLTELTLHTEQGQGIGTPAYMSPEQAEMSGLDVDTRTDVYSLGVMLYELLVGARPLEPWQVAVALRESEPPTPSARFSTLGDQQKWIAAHRRTSPGSLRTALRGDLDWIVMRAMEKDRTRRYETVSGLALDIRRHLNHEPVWAGSPSAFYRLRKFVRRNRPVVIAIAATIVAVVIGSLLATVGFVRATRAETVAREAQLQAEQEAVTANQVSEFLIGLFKVSNPSESRGNQVTAREILDRGAQRIEEELADQPAVQSRLSFTMAQVYRSLGLFQEAQRLAEQSLQQRRSIFEEVSLPVAVGLKELGLVYLNQGHYEQAIGFFQQTLAIYNSLLEPTDARVGRVLNNLASTYVRQAKYDEAMPLYERALIIKVDNFGPDHPETATTLVNMAVLQRRLKNYDSSATLYQRTLEIRVEAFGPDDPSVSRTLNGLANVYINLEQFDSAEVLFRQAIEQKERNLGPDHPQVANSIDNLGIVFARQGDYEKALQYFERALRIRERAYAPDHPRVALSLNNLGLTYRFLERYEDSEAAFQRSLAIVEQRLGPQHPRVAETLDNYANTLREMGRAEEADRLAARADTIEEANRD